MNTNAFFYDTYLAQSQSLVIQYPNMYYSIILILYLSLNISTILNNIFPLIFSFHAIHTSIVYYVPIQNSDKETALHSAAQYGHLEAVQLLLKHGADPNIKSSKVAFIYYVSTIWGFFDPLHPYICKHILCTENKQ